MSQKGLKLVAKVFLQIQLTRQILLREGVAKIGTVEGNQDMYLSQILKKGMEAMKEDFIKATLIKEKKKKLPVQHFSHSRRKIE